MAIGKLASSDEHPVQMAIIDREAGAGTANYLGQVNTSRSAASSYYLETP